MEQSPSRGEIIERRELEAAREEYEDTVRLYYGADREGDMSHMRYNDQALKESQQHYARALAKVLDIGPNGEEVCLSLIQAMHAMSIQVSTDVANWSNSKDQAPTS